MRPLGMVRPVTARGRGPGAVPLRVWQLRIDVPPSTVSALSALLTPEERSRAERGAEPVRRRRTVLRAAVRIVLGERLGLPPHEVPLAAADGRPRLTGGPGAEGLDVSCSASAGLGLVALGEDLVVGVDVEAADGNLASARDWTATEAVAKAEGTGLTGRLPALTGARRRVGPWHLFPVAVPPGWAATVAVGPLKYFHSHPPVVVPAVLDLEDVR